MSRSPTTGRLWPARSCVAAAALLSLSACADGPVQMPGFLKGGGDTVARAATGTADARTERDIEAPEVFHATEAGLWDGRPSLGGVWAAHPDVDEPQRVIIRNQTNGQFVIGALFRRERETPGPRLQISSDAAAALQMLAGQPTNLDVVALIREEAPADAAAPVAAMPAAAEVAEAPLDPVLSDAERAIETAALAPAAPQGSAAPDPATRREAARPQPQPAAEPVRVAAATPARAETSAPRRAASDLDRPYIQIGIFSVEENARNTATAMRQQGMVPTVLEETSSGKTFHRVIVGPAQSASERATLLETIRGSGFTDAFAVRG